MKSRILKDKSRRKLVCSFEQERLVLKSIVRDERLSEAVRWRAGLKLSRLPRNSSRVRVRNRCILTGRPRGVYSKFGLGRSKLREIAMSGQIPGMMKASW